MGIAKICLLSCACTATAARFGAETLRNALGSPPKERRYAGAPPVVALSKCDLLKGPGAVARCARLVEADAHCDVVATCGTTGAGVAALWATLRARCAAVSVRTSDPRAVAVHRSAVK